jgi:putative oxidoreductase
VDTGLLIIRLVVGLTLFAHGGQMLFGWDGPGLRATGDMFDRLGYRPGNVFAVLAGAAQLGGGLCLAIGLLTPLAGAAIVASMLSAGLSVHLRNGFWITRDGFEYALVLGAVGLGCSFTGAGLVSVDRALGWNLGGNAWGVFALAIGLVAGIGTEFYRRRTLPPAAPTAFDESEKRAA